MNSQAASKRPFWRFSLRQLLALSAFLAILLSILAPRLDNAIQHRQTQRAYRSDMAVQAALDRAIAEGLGPARVREALEAGASVSVAMRDNSSPLHSALTLGQCDTVQVLLDHGADPKRVANYNNHPKLYQSASELGPALFAAVNCDQPTDIKIRLVRILLARGADIRREVGGRNLMDIAVFHCDGTIGDLLREYGLPYGPREMAAFNRIEELKRALQASPDVLHQRFKPEYSADISQPSTLLGIALDKGYRDMALFLIEAGASLDSVESVGVTSTHNAARSQTPLHIAALRDDAELISVLAARGADLNARDDDQNTPLTAVVNYRGRVAAVAALIEAGADVNAVNGWGTPLHIAVHNKDVPVIKMLINAGADPAVPNQKGENALDLARNRPELLELLGKAK